MILKNKDRFVNDLNKFNGEVVLSLKELPKQKTNKQNNYYRGVVVKILAKHIGHSQEEMHEILKFKFDVKSTSKLSQDEFQDYLDRIIRWASMYLGVAIPAPTRLQ